MCVNSLEFLLLWHFRKVFYGKIYLTALRVKMPTSRKPIVSYRPYSGDLLILMPRIRILHFLGPESDIDIFYKIAHCHPLIWKVKTRNLQICTVDIWPEKLKNVKREILCPEPNNKWLNCTQLILQNCSLIFRSKWTPKTFKIWRNWSN